MTVVRRQFCFTKEQIKMLEDEAFKTGLKQSEIIRQALLLYLTKVGDQKNVNQNRKKEK